jgi:UDP-glucose 4-epimerase
LLEKNKCVLITGATGAVGPCVVHALHQAGYQIRAFSIDVPTTGIFPQNVEVLIGDVTDRAGVQSAMQGVDAVVHMAALLHIANPPVALQEQYVQVNVDGTARVVEAAIQAGVKRMVFFSTIAVYGNTGGRILDESASLRPDTFYGETKVAAERIVLKAKRRDGEKLGTVLRFGAIYGPRIKGNYQRLVKALAGGRFIPVGNGENRRTLVYERDVALAALMVMQHLDAAGEVYNVSDGTFHTMKEIVSTISAALGRTAPRFSLPVGLVRWPAGVIEDVFYLVGRNSPISRATVNKFVEDVAVSCDRIRSQLGFSPLYDLTAGWNETIREMRKNREL